jgi:hypothetical protein
VSRTPLRIRDLTLHVPDSLSEGDPRYVAVAILQDDRRVAITAWRRRLILSGIDRREEFRAAIRREALRTEPDLAYLRILDYGRRARPIRGW